MVLKWYDDYNSNGTYTAEYFLKITIDKKSSLQFRNNFFTCIFCDDNGRKISTKFQNTTFVKKIQNGYKYIIKGRQRVEKYICKNGNP